MPESSFRALTDSIKESLRGSWFSRFRNTPRISIFIQLYFALYLLTGAMAFIRSVPMGPPVPPLPWRTSSHNAIRKSLGMATEQGELPELLRVFVNGAYYPNWAVYKQGPPSSLNLACISHVFYAFAHVSPDGAICLSDEWADTQIAVDGAYGCLRAFAKLKSEFKHLKVVLSIGGGGKGGEHFASVAQDEEKRRRFACTSHKIVVDYGLNGIDIDWEHPQDPTQGQHYVLLLQELRRHLPAASYILTSALPAGEWALQNIDIYAVSQYLDLINLMAYDFSGPWTPHSGHQAQLFSPKSPHNEHAVNSGHKAVTYLLSKGVPLKKILLGIPVYGRSFLGTNQVGQLPQGQGGEDGVFLYKDLPRPGASAEYVDRVVGAAYSVGGDGGFVTYDNPDTVIMKASYVKEMKLGGIFFWTGAADVRSGPRSLIETSYVTLHNQL